MSKKALEGLNVLGFVTDGVGPITTRLLSMYGATVIQVESEGRPDGTRLRAPFLNNEAGMNRSYRYVMTNPGKYGISLNMKHPDSRKVAKELVKWADVVIDNFRPGVLGKWDLSYEDMKELNEDIIAISLTARGQTGPFAKQAAYGPEVSAMSGFTNLTGWPDRVPVYIGPYTDWVAPHIGIISILSAIEYRNKTGEGQYIDIAQVEGAMSFLAPAVLDYSANRNKQTRSGNKCPYAAPHGVYQCEGEDNWCAITVFTEDEWSRFCRAIGDPDWTKDPKFSTLKDRKENEDELNELVQSWTIDKKHTEVMDILQAAGVQAGALRTVADLYESEPQLDSRKHWNMIMQPGFNEMMRNRGSSCVLSKTPYQFQRPAPEIGQHTEYVLTKILGMSDEQYVELYRNGVLT